VAPAEASDISSSSVDLVTVAQALHWLPIEPFYAEAERVLVPGGVLAVWTYGVQVLEDPHLNRLLQAFYSHIVGPYWAAERRHVESGYRTLPFPFPELTAPSFTMQEKWTLEELLGYVSTWSAAQNFRKAEGRDAVEELARELAPCWGPENTRRGIRWPLSIRLGPRSS
jgi:SAM-dependent methyltransferase